ncbi:hypothetical protein EYD20_27690, partial [Klebsiella pneumoniae]
LMWLMKTLLTSGCTNQRGAGQHTKIKKSFEYLHSCWAKCKHTYKTHYIHFVWRARMASRVCLIHRGDYPHLIPQRDSWYSQR